MNNKQAGNEFEREFCEMLSKDGFWSHFMGGNRNGQPADIIAVRNESMNEKTGKRRWKE